LYTIKVITNTVWHTTAYIILHITQFHSKVVVCQTVFIITVNEVTHRDDPS
jgi:hypothetical protein